MKAMTDAERKDRLISMRNSAKLLADSQPTRRFTVADVLLIFQEFDELWAERDALLAHAPDHAHNEPCLMCGEPCNDMSGNPSLWSLRLGNDGWHHIGCVNNALHELNEVRAKCSHIVSLLREPSKELIHHIAIECSCGTGLAEIFLQSLAAKLEKEKPHV